MILETPIAEHLLARTADDDPLRAAVSALVRGDPGAVAGGLRARATRADEAVERMRAAAYHRLAEHLRWNAFPGGGGAGATEINARWDFGASMPEQGEDWGGLARDVSDAAVLAELRLVGGILCVVRSARVIVDYAAARLEPSQVDAQLEEALAMVAPLRAFEDPALRGYADLAGADLAWRARRAQRAAALLRDAAQTYGTAGDRAGLGACHLLRGDWRAAPAASPETCNLTLVASAAESSALDWALESAESSTDGLDFDAAADAYAEAEEAFAGASARGQAAVALRRGHLAALAGDHAAARHLADESAAASDAVHDSAGAELARVHSALAAVGAGRLTEDAATTEQVGRWGQGPGSFSYALGLGLLCARSGRDWLQRRVDAERALAAHRLARTIFSALGAVTNEAQSVVDAGQVRQVLGDHDGAAAAYEEALDLLTTDLAARPAVAGDNRLRAVTLAQNLYAVQLGRRDPTGMARAAERLRDHADALPADRGEDSVEAALAAAAEGVLAQTAVLVPLYRAEDAREAGDDQAAEEGFAAALDAARSSEDADRDFLEAVVLGHWRRDEEAAVAFTRYLRRQSVRPKGLLGRVLGRVGPLKAEIELARQRLDEQAAAFLCRVRDYRGALRHFEALERRGGAQWWTHLDRPWELLSDYGAAREAVGELSQAQDLHAEAVAQLEARRAQLRRDELKTALGGSTGAAGVYLAAARTGLRRSEAARGAESQALAARAFTDAERGRARALLDLLGAGVSLARAAPGDRAAVRAWHQANAEVALRHGLLAVEQASAHPDPDRVAALREEVAAAEAELQRREADLESADPAFAAAVAVPAPVADLDEVRAALAPRTALLAYHHADEDLLGWAVTADGVAATTRQTVHATDLRRDVRAFTTACVEDGNWDLRGRDLSRLLLDPFAGVLDDADHLVVVPPVAAHAMPFHALPWQDRPLGARHPVSYLPNASSLRFLAGAREPPGRALAVGDPSGMVWQDLPGQSAGPADPLPAAATEAAFVAALFGDSRLLVGDEASEPAVRESIGAYPVVHLATHGQLSEQAPLLSSVLLANGDALSVYELMGLHLDADLVALSACDSGRGRATAGGDVLGPTRGLLAAGARGVVASLWPVSDRTTCVLMAEFYRRLLGGAAPAVALQRAQAQVRRLDGDAEGAAFEAITRAVDDPGGTDLLTPVPADRDPVADAGDGDERERSPYWWAAFVYVGP